MKLPCSDKSNKMTLPAALVPWRMPSARARSGISIVEITVAVSLSSIVLGLVVSLAIALQQMDRRMQHRGIEREQQLRLVESIRIDIRRAADVASPGDDMLVVRLANKGRSEYVIRNGEINRTVISDGGDVIRKESFGIRAAESWSTERDDSGGRPLITISLKRGAIKKAHQTGMPFMVVAVLGADLLEAMIANGSS